MVGVVIATHADLGQGLLNAISLIAGPQSHVKAVGLAHGDGVDEFEKKVYQAIEELDEGDGVLGFVDFIGGTPANTMMKYMREHEFHCVAGANMPMLLEALTNREGFTPQELEDNCLGVGRDGVNSLKKVLEEMMENEEEDDI